MTRSRHFILPVLSALVLFGLGTGCKSSAASATAFKALTSNVSDGDVWALNRPIQVVFNNAVDPASVGFDSVLIRPRTNSSGSRPVLGSFELKADTNGNPNRVLVFVPICPTDELGTTGGFQSGGVEYELLLPTEEAPGTTVLRDVDGRPLSVGLTRVFRTPVPPVEEIYVDTVNGPPSIESVVWPDGLNLFTEDQAFVTVTMDQPVDASPTSLNTDNLFVQYANANGLFPPTGNVVPGTWLVHENCSQSAVLLFQVTGVLPPERGLRVVLTPNLLDLGGNGQNAPVFSDAFQTPSLAEVYARTGFDPDQVTLDEFSEHFLTSAGLDLDADLPLPQAVVEPDRVVADFSYPGDPVPVDQNFVLTASLGVLEIDTTGSVTVTDGLGRNFDVVEGVLQTHDFTIEPGATLRLVGENPFVLYATGEVQLLGTLDASGFDASRPDGGRFHPELPVPGAPGAAGGGEGGTASWVTDDYTPRGESGDGPFGAVGQGGQGGEGGVQQDNAVGTDIEFLIVGGGGGGGFARTRTDAVFWDAWGVEDTPATADDAGPDLRADKHTIFDPVTGAIDPDTYFVGAEDGLRGSSKNGAPFGAAAGGVFGFEDIQYDPDAGNDDVWDPAQTGATIDFEFGNPTFGPDGGQAGPSPFVDPDPDNDFFGQRYYWSGDPNDDPVLVTGELTAPWAGSGGGASGDVQTVLRRDLDGDGILEPLTDFFPDTLFPFGTTINYWRGGGGGGGGGQVQILAIGPIVLGTGTRILANGGSGNSGESTDESADGATVTQVSGSGGGSGGHIVLHSATGLDLSAIPVGIAGDPADPDTFFDNLTPVHLAQAIGGRRGWAASRLNDDLVGAPNSYDGNSTFMVGRGGAGASGVIQIHVPDPITDIAFEASVDAAFKDFMTAQDPTNPVISDRLDQLLGLYAIPQPYALIPFFSPKSQLQSVWIDTGLAGERNPAGGTGPFPDWNSALGAFAGIDAAGYVVQNGNSVAPGAVIASDGGAGLASFGAYQVTVAQASTAFPDTYLYDPGLLIGFDVVPNLGQAPTPSTFEIRDASYDPVGDVLTLDTRVSDGPMNLVASTNWGVRAKYFRLDSSDIKDRLPSSAALRIQFQAADAFAGTNVLDPDSITAWTGEGGVSLADPEFQGKRFLRWRLTFDVDALETGAALSSERPALDYLKVPFGW